MKTVYRGSGGVLYSTPSDCEEMALEEYEEKLYIFAMKRLADSPNDWRERVVRYKQELLRQARVHRAYHWKEYTIMD